MMFKHHPNMHVWRTLQGTIDSICCSWLTAVTVQLKTDSPYYTFTKPEAPADYPFKLKDNECVVAYNENGKAKYFKITKITEFAGTYYENGPPAIYARENAKDIVAIEDENIDK